MPSKVASVSKEDQRKFLSTTHTSEATAVASSKKRPSATGMGLELGTLGRANRTQSDVAGLQLFFGGRFFVRMPVFDDFYLVPSLGYFRKREGAGSAGVTQHLIEGGLTAYYNAWTGRKARWFVGGMAKAEYALSEIYAFNASSSGEGVFRFRAGPATGIAVGISSEWSFVANLELGFSLGDATRIQPGIAMGLIYYLP